MLIDTWNRTYCGSPPAPEIIWQSWNFDPIVLAALALLGLCLRRHKAGLSAVAILFVIFISPLCALSSALFSARVVHHLLLILIAAPLFAWCWPTRRPHKLMLPFAISTLILWGWHVPAAYDLALSHIGVYWLMQLSLLTSAIWFWREVLARERLPVDAIMFAVLGFAQMGLLGALLTFAPNVLYSAHALAPLQWGLLPLTDQQLAGLLMWVPAGLPYAWVIFYIGQRSWRYLQSNTTKVAIDD